jgi:quinol monooxygenase YgiN
MIICEVYYSVAEGRRPELMKLAEANVRASRKEEGNIAYTHYPSMENETDMFVFEIWESPEALERHIHADHYLEFSRLRKPMLTSYKFLNYEAEKIAEGDSIPTWS